MSPAQVRVVKQLAMEGKRRVMRFPLENGTSVGNDTWRIRG